MSDPWPQRLGCCDLLRRSGKGWDLLLHQGMEICRLHKLLSAAWAKRTSDTSSREERCWHLFISEEAPHLHHKLGSIWLSLGFHCLLEELSSGLSLVSAVWLRHQTLALWSTWHLLSWVTKYWCNDWVFCHVISWKALEPKGASC